MDDNGLLKAEITAEAIGRPSRLVGVNLHSP
jgi:hypothetical protein